MSNSQMPWVKLYTEILDDPKIGRLPDVTKWRFVQLILYAGELDSEGYLPQNLEDVAWRLRIDTATLIQDLQTLSRAGLVHYEEDTGMWCVTKFSDRQGRSQATKREQWRERQRRHRDSAEDVTQESPVTNGGVTPLEESREEEINNGAGAPPATTSKPLKHPEREELIKYFLIKTGLPAPKTRTQSDIKAAQKLWWGPADEILELGCNDPPTCRSLIDASLARLRDVTVSDMNSIIKTARAVYAEQVNGKPGTSLADLDIPYLGG